MADGLRAPVPVASAAVDGPAFLSASQHEAANAIRRALAERHVFAAVTGAPGLGKTVVLSTVGAGQFGPPLRVVRIDQPDQVSIEQAAQLPGASPGLCHTPGSCHVVIVVDDADRASSALLRALTRLAGSSRTDPAPPQVILAGRPELWDRLAADEFTPLRERIAIRPVLRPMADEDARAFIRHLLNEPRKIFGQAFAEDAEREVLGLAEGTPKRIGALVRSTLMLGDLQVRPQLSVEMVRATADMLDGRPQPGGQRRIGVLRPALAAALALAVGGLVFAARDGRLDPMLSAVRGAGGAVAGWTRPAGGAPAVLAGTPGTAPAERPDAGAPPGPAPDVPPIAPVQTTAPASLPAAAAPAASVPPEPAAAPAAQAEAEHGLAAESPPSQATAPEPAPQAEAPAAALPEQEAPAAAASAVPVPDILPETGRAPDMSASSDPALAAEAPASQPDAPAVEAAAAPQAVPDPAPAQAPEVAASDPNPGPTVSTPPATPAPDVVATLLRRGDEMLARGDVSTARQFYERALSSGSTLGARSLARTYDPAAPGRGPAADPDAAAAWHDRAARLADSEASARPSRRAAR